MTKDELVNIASDLPVEQRVEIADSVLKTFDPSDPEVDEAWLKEARRRLKEFKEGRPMSATEDELVHGPEPLPPKVTDVQPLRDCKLQLRFETGEQRLMDMKPYMRGVFKQLEDPEFFNQVRLESFGGITWPGELDLSPGMLYLYIFLNRSNSVVIILNPMSLWFIRSYLSMTQR